MTQERLQEILEQGQKAAECSAPRKVRVYTKNFAKSTTQRVKRVRQGDVSEAVVSSRPAAFPNEAYEAQGNVLWYICCGNSNSN